MQAQCLSCQIPAEQLTLVLLDFFAAGTETTSSILLWALVYLVNNPDLQEQLFQDIRNKVGVDNLPSIKDKTKLPFVDAFMMECLRYCIFVYICKISHL